MPASGEKKEITEVKANNMKLVEVVKALELKFFTEAGVDADVRGGYVSDLLSDVMGNAREGDLWITLQSHSNVIAIASLKDVAGIVLVNGIEPDEAVLAKAAVEEIPVLGTTKSTYEITGLLYKLLNE